MKEKHLKVFTIVGIVLFALALSFAVNYPIMLLWNWLMPKLFNLPTLFFWEMYGASLLVSVLTSCFRKPSK